MNGEDFIRELDDRCHRSWSNSEGQRDLYGQPKVGEIKRPDNLPRYPAPPQLDFSKQNPIINERFIAGVDPRYPETFFWEKAALAHSTGYMPSYHVFRETEKGKAMADTFRKGSESAKLILSGVIPDDLQTSENEQKHVELGVSSNAYALTTFEWSLYDDDPAYYSVPLLFRYLDSLRLYHQTDKNVYPYLIGANEFELEACAYFLKEMGFQVVFYDATCMVRCRKWRALRHRISWLERHFKQVVVSNYCSFNLRFRNISFMTPTWFKVPRQIGQLVHGNRPMKNDIIEQGALTVEALMQRSFMNIRDSLTDMNSQQLLTDYILEKPIEQSMVNLYGVVERR